MRIKAIALSWFRGAADKVSMEPACKSMVVYGSNGAGKSSFVDAVEFILHDGKIGHLAHEYSGRRQERALANTHKPKDQRAELSIMYQDDSELKVAFHQDGSSESSGGEVAAMRSWEYRSTVLRQDEVAQFIHDTKGNKYSALLPLLGMHSLEVAAENLRQLAKSVEENSRLKEMRADVKHVQTKRQATFGTQSDADILAKIQALHAKYCLDKVDTDDARVCCEELKVAVDALVAASSADQHRHAAQQEASALDIQGHVQAVRVASGQLAGAAEPLIAEKLEVLQRTVVFVQQTGDKNDVECPACGRVIAVDDLQQHVTAERERLRDLITIFETHKAAVGTLCHAVRSLKSNISKPDVKSWWGDLAMGRLAARLKYLAGIDIEALHASCGENELQAVEENLLPLIAAATEAANDAPPGAQQLTADKQLAEAGSDVFASSEQIAALQRAESLVSFITSLEQGVREEIRMRSQTVIDELSAEVQAMWATLHPGQSIESVRLILPKDTDKAIDIGLKFHGVEQESPRLTLSEGYRNSLGLCIFLAMAKRHVDQDRPIFLDDIVVSLDRNHRGMIANLLETEFSGRQVVILTHDRDWYTELRQQLDGKDWSFKALLPYEAPHIGIRWSHKTTTFDDARAQLPQRPDSAGNDARKIMDVELALIAERLQIRMPYVRGDKNDKRMAHDFLERLISDGKNCFQMKAGDSHSAHTDAISSFEEAARLIVSWGNKASHTFDVVRPEATKLIDVCEQALESFKCPACKKAVWFANAEAAKSVQCSCGQMRWRYGKG